MEAFPPEWMPVGTVDEFPAERGKLVKIGARRIGVYRQGERWFALKDACPHAGVGLSQGPVKDGAVLCVGHGWTFDLASGAVRQGAKACKVASYPVRVVGNVVEVGV